MYLAALENSLAYASNRRSHVLRELISATAEEDHNSMAQQFKVVDARKNVGYSRRLLALGEDLPPEVYITMATSSWLSATGRLTSDAVWGGRVDKTDVLASFKRGRPQVLSNVNLLCEGFNAPETSAVFICRLMKNWRMIT